MAYLDGNGLLYFWQKIKDEFADKGEAIKSISRSGTTFTVTRTDGTTFTFDQQDNDTTYSVATQSVAGLMSAADKTKLDGVATGATANTGTVTSVATGTGLTGGTITGSGTIKAKLKSETSATNDSATPTNTSSRQYAVTPDKSGYLSVNVPWENTTYSDATTSTHGLMSASDKTKLNGIASGAEVNQNAFSNVKVGSTTVAADSKTDTLELVAGSNVTLTPDDTNDKVTIAATDTTYSAATQSAAGLMSAADKKKLDGVATGATANTGTVTSVATGTGLTGGTITGSGTIKAKLKSETAATYDSATPTNSASRQYAVTPDKSGYLSVNVPWSNTTYSDATTSAHGLMSTADKTKLDGIASGAEVNQNAFSTVQFTSGNIITAEKSASGKTSTLAFTVGNNVNIETNEDDEIVISATDTTYSNATTSAAGLMSTSDKSKLNGIASGAEVNQNAFSNVVVGSTTIAADSKTDTLNLVAGSNVTLTPDASGDTVTIAATDTTYSAATTSAAGLMSAADKVKLNTISSYAEANVPSDWSVTNSASDAYIHNKPSIPKIWTGTCSTAATTGIKVITLDNIMGFTFSNGTRIAIWFENGNTESSPMLSIGDTVCAVARFNDLSDPTSVTAITTSSLYKGWGCGTIYFTYYNNGTKAYWYIDNANLAQISQLNSQKANLASPNFSGTPTAPTAAAGTNTTQIATTAFVKTAVTNATPSDATTSASGLMSSTDKTKLNGIASGAEVNQNAFSNVVVGSTTIAADGKTDTLTLVAGSNVTLTPDATNDKVTIAATDTTYTNMTQTEATTGTATTARSISAKVLNDTIDNKIATAQTGAALFKGTVSTGTDISGLTAYSKGWYWVVSTAGTYAGQGCEPGDMIFCVSNRGSAYSASDFTIVQNNIVTITNAEIDTIVAS